MLAAGCVYSVRGLVKTGAQRRHLPSDFPPWTGVYHQVCHWLDAKVFETLMHDLRKLLPLAEQRAAQPSSVIMDGRTLHSTLKSARAPALVATSRVIRRAPWCDTELSLSVLSMLLETGRIDQDVSPRVLLRGIATIVRAARRCIEP